MYSYELGQQQLNRTAVDIITQYWPITDRSVSVPCCPKCTHMKIIMQKKIFGIIQNDYLIIITIIYY